MTAIDSGAALAAACSPKARLMQLAHGRLPLSLMARLGTGGIRTLSTNPKLAPAGRSDARHRLCLSDPRGSNTSYQQQPDSIVGMTTIAALDKDMVVEECKPAPAPPVQPEPANPVALLEPNGNAVVN